MKRFSKFLSRLKHRFVPHNLRYRPKDVYKKGQDNSVVYYDIYPSFNSVLNLPPDLYNACTDYVKTPKSVDFPPSYVIDIEEGRVLASNMYVNIISKKDEVVSEASYYHVAMNLLGDPTANPIFRQKYFYEPIKHKGTVFSMLSGGGAVINYSHWLIDAIPRIGLLKKSGLFNKVDKFLVPNYKYDYHFETLELLGIPSSKVIIGNEYNHIQADKIIATSNPRHIGHFPYWIGTFLRDSYLNTIAPTEFPSRIYIRRSDSSLRNILNEDKLVAALKPFGFVDYELSKLSFAQKVNLFRSADYIISAGGAALGNLVFCKKEVKALEIFSSTYVSTMFADIAIRMGLEYHYLIVDVNKKYKKIDQAQKEHFAVDIDKIIKKLETLLSSKETNQSNIVGSK
jgi:hypothetical protein